MPFLIGWKSHIFARGLDALFSAHEARIANHRRGRCSGIAILAVLFF